MSQREKKGYALKKERGLVPFQYEKNSKSFAEGAWKHWDRDTQQRFRRRLNRESDNV
jgi:hypothetical protein